MSRRGKAVIVTFETGEEEVFRTCIEASRFLVFVGYTTRTPEQVRSSLFKVLNGAGPCRDLKELDFRYKF